MVGGGIERVEDEEVEEEDDDTFREDLIDLLDIIAEKITTFTDKHRK